MWPQAVILATKRVRSGPAFRGGITSYAKTRREILRLLGDTSVDLVTTMVDVYGLPEDFPGYTTRPASPPEGKVAHLEQAIRADIDNPRFLPYLSLHEFEALLFTEPQAIVTKVLAVRDGDRVRRLEFIGSGVRTSEEIDDGPETAPSKRISACLREYDKVRHAPLITHAIGLVRIREACPHFDGWLRRLEELGR